MSRLIVSSVFSRKAAKCAAVAVALLGAVRCGSAQDTPLLSGGAAFFTSTNGGNTTYTPIIEPLLAAPIGRHLLIESRATLLESFFPNGNGKSGYDHAHVVALNYLQGDYFITPHVTLVGGSFLIPFGTYNERLSEIWIENFQDGPLISGLGTFTSSGVGGELRGSAISRPKYSIDYAAYFSTRSAHEQFLANRSSGGRASLYLPQSRLEVGLSYGRLLEGQQENFYGAHVWWEPEHTAFRLRSEFARAHHVQGYWAEADYRTQAFGGLDSWIGRFEPVFRIQQTFRRDAIVSDGLPLVNNQRVDFGFNYNLPHNTRILTSYSRQFSSSGNKNIWETGIVYRFLFPAWKGTIGKAP
ncbi:MAG: hypothetical protein JWM54_2225 [Acidobacteriaceae bacterium]|jgi:hypothetical protein|nr:hypothetical protein [Acidobacteriaceae bacterium]